MAAPSETIKSALLLAVAFVLLRIAHGVCYLADLPVPRSLAWVAGYACALGLLGLAALNVA